MRLKYDTLDVFTDRRFGGNPLAVIHGADELSKDEMQTIAREMNLSETVFVLKPKNPAHSARVRIFTPAVELPFAGHPTVGTAALLGQLRMGGNDGEALVVLEEEIGVVRVGVKVKNGQAAFAEFDAPKLPEPGVSLPSSERLAQALGLIPTEIGFENHRPMVYSAGVPFAFIPVANAKAIAQAQPQMSHWNSVFTGPIPPAAFLYTRETIHTTSAFHARMFAPSFGMVEDPATGGAAAAFAGIVAKFDAPRAGTHRKLIEQGFEMGRPSLIHLTLIIGPSKLETVRIGGYAVHIASGEITVR
jgi:trans-2,3-dihydro-3-hydroxyanthranilate isomerase